MTTLFQNSIECSTDNRIFKMKKLYIQMDPFEQIILRLRIPLWQVFQYAAIFFITFWDIGYFKNSSKNYRKVQIIEIKDCLKRKWKNLSSVILLKYYTQLSDQLTAK